MITTRFLEWAAGFVEGEGCFVYTGRGLKVTVHQVNREPLDRLQRTLGGRIRFEDRRRTNPKHSPIYEWTLQRGAAGLMMTLYPLMSLGRRAQIRRALDVWRTIPRPGQHMRQRTHCPHGHVYDGVVIGKTGVRRQRTCLACRRNISARYYQRKRLRAATGL